MESRENVRDSEYAIKNFFDFFGLSDPNPMPKNDKVLRDQGSWAYPQRPGIIHKFIFGAYISTIGPCLYYKIEMGLGLLLLWPVIVHKYVLRHFVKNVGLFIKNKYY